MIFNAGQWEFEREHIGICSRIGIISVISLDDYYLSLDVTRETRIRIYDKIWNEGFSEKAIYICVADREMMVEVMMETGNLMCDILEKIEPEIEEMNKNNAIVYQDDLNDAGGTEISDYKNCLRWSTQISSIWKEGKKRGLIKSRKSYTYRVAGRKSVKFYTFDRKTETYKNYCKMSQEKKVELYRSLKTKYNLVKYWARHNDVRAYNWNEFKMMIRKGFRPRRLGKRELYDEYASAISIVKGKLVYWANMSNYKSSN
jgi:hypothetical protein